MGRKLLLVVMLLVIVTRLYSQNKSIDSLKGALAISKEDTSKCQILLKLTTSYWELDADSSIRFGKMNLDLSRQLNDAFLIGQANKSLGVAYDYKGNLDSCLFYLQEALQNFKQCHRPENESHVLSDIAIAWYYRGNYELALRNHLAALKLRQVIGDPKFIAISYNNLGLVYRSKKEYAKAITYYQQSVDLKRKAKDEMGVMNTLMNIGSAFQSSNQYDSAYYYGREALHLANKLNSSSDVLACRGNMAAALVNLQRGDEAFPILMEVEKEAVKEGDKKILFLNHEALGDYFIQKGVLTQAEFHFRQGLDLSNLMQRLEAIELFTRKLAKVLFLQGQFKEAYQYLNENRKISDSLFNAENARQMNEMAAVYETAEKEKKISQLDAARVIAITDAAKRKNENRYLLFLTLLFLGMAILSYKAYTANKRKKELLNQKNIQIEKALQEKEYLMREIHHRVKNNLQMVSSLLSLQSNYITDESALEAVKDSRNRVHSMSLIHQSLYNEDDLARIDVNEYIHRLAENLFQSYTNHDHSISWKADIDAIKLDVETVIPIGLIINELITNSLKYAFPDQASGHIRIGLHLHDDRLKLHVYDNGKGLPADYAMEQQVSFGHKMISAFLRKMNGTMNMYSEDGTKVEIDIPYTQKIV